MKMTLFVINLKKIFEKCLKMRAFEKITKNREFFEKQKPKNNNFDRFFRSNRPVEESRPTRRITQPDRFPSLVRPIIVVQVGATLCFLNFENPINHKTKYSNFHPIRRHFLILFQKYARM